MYRKNIEKKGIVILVLGVKDVMAVLCLLKEEERMRRGFRGWEVQYNDGTIINEDHAEWKDIPKHGISRLTLHYDGRQWDLVGKQVYFQKKMGSCVPGIPDSFRVESRTIGYYEDYYKVMYTVDEFSGKMKMETKEIK